MSEEDRKRAMHISRAEYDLRQALYRKEITLDEFNEKFADLKSKKVVTE